MCRERLALPGVLDRDVLTFVPASIATVLDRTDSSVGRR